MHLLFRLLALVMNLSSDSRLDYSDTNLTNDYEYVFFSVEKCVPEADEFSSCDDLMANSALQVNKFRFKVSHD